MKSISFVLALLALSVTLTWAAGTQTRGRDQDRIQDPAVCQCVDANGDGICDNCGACIPKGQDDDADGIPNGQDDDYTPPQDGSGRP